MNYDDMPAGPEMDFLVATKFLGQEPPGVIGWPKLYSVHMFLLTEMLKKLVSDEYEVYIKISFDGSVECDIVQEEGLVHCEQLGEYPGWGKVADGFVETLDEIPLAVCRACLKLKDLK